MEQVALAAVADGRFDVLLIVYNFVQQEQGRAILAACREKQVGATLMKVNPVGGYLEMKAEVEAMEKESKPVPDYLKRLMPRLKEKADAAEGFIGRLGLSGAAQVRDAAVRFALAHPDVGSVCVSFNNFDDVKAHLALSGTALTEADAAKLALWREACGPLYCRHACGLCQGSCPRGVPVNTIMRFHHYFAAQGRERHAMEEYRGLRAPKPDGCAGCAGHCEAACPFGVPIQGLLAVAHRRLTLA
jgi:predicted aldo/keto reductase-like oxidoreductase